MTTAVPSPRVDALVAVDVLRRGDRGANSRLVGDHVRTITRIGAEVVGGVAGLVAEEEHVADRGAMDGRGGRQTRGRGVLDTHHQPLVDDRARGPHDLDPIRTAKTTADAHLHIGRGRCRRPSSTGVWSLPT